MAVKHVDWNQEYPEVPETVHRSVLHALSALDEQEQEVRRMKKAPKKRIILLAAALAALVGTTAAAAGVFRWNDRAEQVFEADEEMQKELTMNQMAEEVSQTVTDQGLTITAIQTIQDRHRFYALFEVTAEDAGMQITSDCSMDYTLDFGGNEDPFCAREWGFVSESDQEVSNTRYFEIRGTKHEESDEDLVMNLHFTGLRGEPAQKAGEGELLVSGTWDFSLNLRTSDMISHEVEREYEVDGYGVYIKSVAFSPLSMTIVYDGADVRAMEAGKEICLDQLDELTELYPTGVRYADGTVVNDGTVDGGVMIPLSEGFRNGEETFELLLPFNKVVDPGQINALLIGDVAIEL